MSVVIVHLPGAKESSLIQEVASRGVAISNPVIQIASPDPTPSIQFEESTTDESGDASHTAGDPLVQSMLFGRYTGQIDARIQRAWRKPRSAINERFSGESDADQVADDMFRCQARIKQDERGNVKEIELMQCNASPAWQLSLVRAIQRASPLPAPPNPSVFTNVLTLAFEARAYVPGYREDEYEPVPNTRLTNAAY